MILTIATQKGGTGKTTTSACIAQALAYKGKSALLIDMDAQGSASLIYGADGSGSGGSHSLVMGTRPAATLIRQTPAGDIIPASPLLNRLEIELANRPGRDSLLKAALLPVQAQYNLIVIDTGPGLSVPLVQALTAADCVIIPLLADPQALQGLHQVTETIEQVQKFCNPSLRIAGVVLTQHDKRTTLGRQFEAFITEQCREMEIPLAQTRIRRAISVQESQARRESLYTYAPKSNPAADYLALCEEIGLLKPTKKKGR